MFSHRYQVLFEIGSKLNKSLAYATKENTFQTHLCITLPRLIFDFYDCFDFCDGWCSLATSGGNIAHAGSIIWRSFRYDGGGGDIHCDLRYGRDFGELIRNRV